MHFCSKVCIFQTICPPRPYCSKDSSSFRVKCWVHLKAWLTLWYRGCCMSMMPHIMYFHREASCSNNRRLRGYRHIKAMRKTFQTKVTSTSQQGKKLSRIQSVRTVNATSIQVWIYSQKQCIYVIFRQVRLNYSSFNLPLTHNWKKVSVLMMKHPSMPIFIWQRCNYGQMFCCVVK